MIPVTILLLSAQTPRLALPDPACTSQRVVDVVADLPCLAELLGFGFCCWGSPFDHTTLTMGRISERIEIHAIRQERAPSSSWTLQDVYGDQSPPVDAWGRPFQLVVPGPVGTRYDLVSYGADGQPGARCGGDDRDIYWSAVR